MPDSDFLLTVSSTTGHKGFINTESRNGDPVLEGKGSLEVIWLNPTAAQAGPLSWLPRTVHSLLMLHHLTVKKYFLMFRWNLHCFSLCPLPIVQSGMSFHVVMYTNSPHFMVHKPFLHLSPSVLAIRML